MEKSGGSLAEDPLRALSTTVSENADKLRAFASILLQSEDTVCVAKDILKEYGKRVVNLNYAIFTLFLYRPKFSTSNYTSLSIRYSQDII